MYSSYKLPIDRILNMDETSLSVSIKMRKVVSLKHKKKVSKVTWGDNAEIVTLVICVSSTGFLVTLAMILFRVWYLEHFYKNALEGGTALFHNETGYINTSSFLDWLKYFQQYVKASVDNLALLLLDK